MQSWKVPCWPGMRPWLRGTISYQAPARAHQRQIARVVRDAPEHHAPLLLLHAPAQELKILILPGMLHLAGYDHEFDGGEMARLEERLRLELGRAAGVEDDVVVLSCIL